MLIDWFTVGAQFINFLVLVWLLKRFLYKPILNAIDIREKRIAAELADADAKKADAQKDRDELQTKNKKFDDERSGLLAKASSDGDSEREKLMAQTRKDADGLRAARAAALQSEQLKLGTEITRMAKDEVFAIVRKTLADLATVSLEERFVEVFTRRLREIPGTLKTTLAAALKTSSEPAVLRSTFNLPTEQKAAIQNALNETFSDQVRIKFETGSTGVCGVELSVNGQKLSWTIDEYLGSLNEKVGTLLAARVAGAK